MTVHVVRDEFEERARRLAEAHELGEEYALGLRRRALTAFWIGGACLFVMWSVWRCATRPLPDSVERNVLVEALRGHGDR